MDVDVLLYRGTKNGVTGIYGKILDTPYEFLASTVDLGQNTPNYLFQIGDGFLFDAVDIPGLGDYQYLTFSNGGTTTVDLVDDLGNLIIDPSAYSYRPGTYGQPNANIYFIGTTTSVTADSSFSSGLFKFDGTGTPELVFSQPVLSAAYASDGILAYHGWDGTHSSFSFQDYAGNSTTTFSTTQVVEYMFTMNGEIYVDTDTTGVTNFSKLNGTNDGFDALNLFNDGRIHFSTLWVGETQFFFKSRYENHLLGNELYVSDGTAAGTKLVKDINPGTDSSRVLNSLDVIVGNKFFFTADDGSGDGAELFVSDGTEIGTIKLTGTGVANSVGPASFGNNGYGIAADDKLFFQANTATASQALFVSDGTVSGTKLVMDFNSPVDDFYWDGEHLYFTFSSGSGGRHEVWRSDGTTNGTVAVTQSTDPQTLGTGHAYFSRVVLDLDNIAPLQMNGTAQGDTLNGTFLSETINGLGGDDTLFGLGGNDKLVGGNGNDKAYAGKGADQVYLGDGNDYVRVGGGVESFYGGSGSDDYISYYDSSGGITIRLEDDSISGSWANNDLISGFESAGGSNTGGDRMYGGAGENRLKSYGGNDSLYGGSHSDKVYGGSGHDKVYGGSSSDTVYGGSGNDTVFGGSSGDSVFGGSGDDKVYGGSSTDTVYGGTGNDTLYGGTNADKLYGGVGDDKFYGGSSNDKMYGGDGDDYFRADGGAESFFGGTGTDDYISYYKSSGGIEIDLRASTVEGSWSGNDVISGFESASGSNVGSDKMLGTNGDNRLKGNGGNDSLYGRSGDDKLYGGKGVDRFDGGAGIDSLYGGDGEDVFHFDRGEDTDYVKDFENNNDTIQFDNFAYLSDAASALAFATESGGDVTFDFGVDGTLIVENTTKSKLLNDIEIV